MVGGAEDNSTSTSPFDEKGDADAESPPGVTPPSPAPAETAAAAEAEPSTTPRTMDTLVDSPLPNTAASPEEPSVEVSFQLHNTPDDAPHISAFDDHFTLQIPSSVIRYRDKKAAARVIETSEAQFVLEETVDADTNVHRVSIRRIYDTEAGVHFLRIIYTTVTAFWTGFFFVFCLQILLFLFHDLALQTGQTTKQEANVGQAVGAVLAFPGFVYSFASALVIAGAYILDTWRGHLLVRNFTFRKLKAATVEWVFFFFFLGFPLFIMGSTLLARTDRWWEYTTLVWFSSVAAFYCLFAANVVFYEMKSCWDVTKNKNHHDNASWRDLITKSILSRQIHRYSGRRTYTFLSIGSIRDAEYTDSDSRHNVLEETKQEELNWQAKVSRWKKLQDWGLFEAVPEQSERIYSVDDARDVRPFVTSHTWSLEKIFCRPRNSRFIAVIEGPGALTKSQIKSSMACSLVGSFLIFFLFLAVLVYLELGAIFTTFGVAVGILAATPRLRATYKLYSTRTELMSSIRKSFRKLLVVGSKDKDDANVDAEAGGTDEENNKNEMVPEESQCVYLQQEIYRVTRPTPRLCWIIFGVEIILFFIYPLAALFNIGNNPLALMFFFFVGISLLRYYVNAAVVLEETGRMDLVDGATKLELWKEQSRLNEIVGNITRGRSLNAWISVLASLGFIFLALMLGAVGTSQENQESGIPKQFATTNFEYIQSDSLRYPSCQLSADLGASPLTKMADYAFLAGLAYQSEEVTQTDLNTFFQRNLTDQVDVVKKYRLDAGTPSHVSFKLVTVPVRGDGGGEFAYVLIRGTTNNWDVLTDAQLWSAAALLQVLRELLPLGAAWTPIMDQLIDAITVLESKSLDSVSFYKDTTAFVEYVKTLGYEGIAITGHSLGGGLSIITGAQTHLPAVALSGPNAMLSRRSFEPRVSAEDLNSKTFNIIPERDLVPKIDDVAQNFQTIRCEAEFEDVIGCHSAARSLCEILYSCGSEGRPIPCKCVTEFGYPLPVKKDQSVPESFEQVCGIAE